jgi:hypothetical protein
MELDYTKQSLNNEKQIILKLITVYLLIIISEKSNEKQRQGG